MTLFKEETMLVHPVVIPGSGTRSWTLLGDGDGPVVPVDRFLAYLTDIGRSPNTVRAYAFDLKDYWEFISFRSLDWREARLEDVGEFVAWLQLPPAGRSGEVAVLPSATAGVTAATVNRKLAAVSAFYAHQARNGAEVGDLLAAWKAGGRGGWKPFLHHVSKGKPYRGRAIALKAPNKLPRILTAAEAQGKPWACVMRTSPPPSPRSASCRGRTRTGREPSPGAGRSPSGRSWSGSMPTTCTRSTAGSTVIMSSSTSGRSRRGTRGRIRPPMTSSCVSGPGPGSRSIPTGSGTERRPGGCATASRSRSCPRCLVIRR